MNVAIADYKVHLGLKEEPKKRKILPKKRVYRKPKPTLSNPKILANIEASEEDDSWSFSDFYYNNIGYFFTVVLILGIAFIMYAYRKLYGKKSESNMVNNQAPPGHYPVNRR